MNEFKFEYELNPISRASAALDNEGQRISDDLEQARDAMSAKRQLADWSEVRRDLRSHQNEGSGIPQPLVHRSKTSAGS